MRDARVQVFTVSAASGAVTVVAALLPRMDFAWRLPQPRVALDTGPPLIALLAGFLVLGRLPRHARLTELVLACSFGTLAVSGLAFVTVPVLLQRFWPDLSVWAALAGSLFGAGLFALAAFVTPRPVGRLRPALAVGTAAAAATLLLIAVLATAFAAHLPQVSPAATARGGLTRPDGPAGAVLPALESIVAVIYGLAAVGFLRRSVRFRDDFFSWLAVASVLGAAAHLNYFLHAPLYSQSVSIGDIFLLCFYLVLLAGSGQELWSYWRAPSETAVLEERQRIARDLHDGLAQELAYLYRNLESLDGAVDRETKARLRDAAERAQLEVRQAINTLAAPQSRPVAVAIAQAVGEVAARDHIKVELDVVPGIRLPAARAEALTRIACEAVGNAARHSGAGRVSLSLKHRGKQVRLRVSDDGSGFDLSVPADGFGLKSMRDRALSVGGNLRISSEPGHGTDVEATL